MKKLEEKFNQILLIEMGYSVVYTLLGLIIFLKSEIANNVAGILIGIFFILNGLIQIYTYIDKSKIRLFKSNLFLGILNVLLGIFIMLNPLTLLNILNIGLGLAILVDGINKFILFLNLKKAKEECNKVILVSTLLLIFMGVMLIINPFRTLVVTKTVGAFIMLYNIVNLNDLVLLKRRSKKFIKNIK